MGEPLFDKDWVDAYFDHGIDVKNRRVFLDADIECESIGAAVRGLYLMETVSNEEPVEIFISSYGGNVHEALAMYDIMNTIKCPIHTFAYGKCMSAAPLILAAGEPGHRWVAPHVAFMHHDWSAGVEGTASQVQAEVKHYEEIGKAWTELLAKHSSQNFKWWHTRAKKAADFYFTAEEAIEWGIADQMWMERE
jgi:ATP-dependent Clp protease protease subunit